jgi:multidrug efflux pump subunit AcrB
MKITQFCIENRVTTLVLTVVLVVGGIVSYAGMGRLEDPAFTIKDALIITPYPGATAAEVEEEVSDVIEIAVQKLKQLLEVESRSTPGLSIVTASIKDSYDKETLPQVWDELRRKVGDAQRELPPGAGPSLVNDDFGDVYGIFFTLYGDGYSYAELYETAKLLRRELLLVQDVAKIDFFGLQPEVVYVELDRDRMSQLGISMSAVAASLQSKNVAAYAGHVQVGSDFVTIDPTGLFNSVSDFESLLISGQPGGAQIYLRDIATVRRGYRDPARQVIRFDGNASIGLGISTVPDGNVVTMGDGVAQRMRELQPQIPLGMDVGVISLQSAAVTTAISSFLVSLLQAVTIVVVVLLFFMGFRSGMLIGFILFLTIAGSFIIMPRMGVMLERISLGALIIALGMLVDNAIVVVDGMLVKMEQGVEKVRAAVDTVQQTAAPLLGATVIAVLAFAAIGTSQDNTGEYTRSLYTVILISLLLSWVTAVTVTPVLGIMVLKPKVPKPGEAPADPYDSTFYRKFRGVLSGAIRRRWITMGIVVTVFVMALVGFGRVEQSFFPNSTRPQFMVDYWLPQGTHIAITERDAAEIEQWMLEQEGVTQVGTVIGAGAMRFLLTYVPEKENSAYAQFLVDVDDHSKIDGMLASFQDHLQEAYPGALVQTRKYILGPGEPGKIQARFFGPDPDVLRSLATQAEVIFRAEPNLLGVKTDWRERVKVLRPVIAEEQANIAGITRTDISTALLQAFEGASFGVYRERDELLPIVARAPALERADVANIQNIQIFSPTAGRSIPLRQVVSGFETTFEDDIIIRMNRKRAIKVLADPRVGEAPPMLAKVRPLVEAIELPEGYTLEWWGEYKDSKRAQASLAASFPVFVLLMLLITIGLFNSLKQTAVIWLVVPLALIGVTLGLLSTGQPFGFMALLGFMSLIGMLIKNAIVLIDEINAQRKAGLADYDAILASGMSRLRPVAMAAATTILGMLPLVPDAFFVSMAVTVMFGLGVATILTMVVVPTLFAIFYRVKVA